MPWTQKPMHHTLLVQSFPKTPRTQSEASQFGGSHNYKNKTNYLPSFLDRPDVLGLWVWVGNNLGGYFRYEKQWNMGQSLGAIGNSLRTLLRTWRTQWEQTT
jgi:hypothetical protein